MYRRLIIFELLLVLSACGNNEKEDLPFEEYIYKENIVNSTQLALLDSSYSPILLKGVITPEKNIVLSSINSGIITSIFKNEGDKIKKNELVAVLDTLPFYYDFEKIKKRLETKLIVYNKTYINRLGSREISFQDSLILGNHISEEIGLNLLSLEYKIARNSLLNCQIYSNSDGFIDEVYVKQGQFIGSNQKIYSILSNKKKIVINVPIGSKLNFDDISKFEAKINGNDKLYLILVEKVLPKIEKDGTYKVICSSDAVDLFFYNENIMVQLFLPSEKFIRIPKSAIVNKNGKSVLFTIESDSIVKWNYVNIKKENESSFYLSDTVLNGSTIIIDNNSYLKDGAILKNR